YTKDTSALKINQAFSVPLGQIYKIEIIEKDKKRSSGSFVSAGLIIVGTVAAILVIAALTKSSCPFVSVFNGDQYVLQGELFGGAVNPNLQRRDYVPLDIKPFRGEYWLRISNELKERQYTDYADLIFLEHQPDARAGMDATGVPYLLSDPIAPIEASLNHNSDVVDLISQADSVSCTFNDTTSISSLNDLYLSFPNPNAKHEGKLVLRLKNSYWFDYLYGEFMSNFGRRFNHWQKKQRHLPGEKMIQWTREQQIPITVSIATADGWKETFKLNSIGPLMDREVVIPLEWDKHQNDPVQVRLTTGFMFWELNYAALDYTEDQPVITTTLHPYSAMDETGQDVLAQLLQEDRQFLTQLETGNFATLKYK
ncbi:MAG TPA: hypothetical protein VJ508_00545, partial [Saprospiraceae bacterium]|nr:hypothetical protein [Saprospiraceae bacterium]